jgi:hypothetical protein
VLFIFFPMFVTVHGMPSMVATMPTGPDGPCVFCGHPTLLAVRQNGQDQRGVLNLNHD